MSWLRPRLVTLVLLLALLGSSTPAAAHEGAAPGAADTRERFFGAVQSIYNPDRAAQAGVQWERLIFPWSLIQKDGPTSWAEGYFTDQQITQEASRGIQIVGLAAYTPQWATSTPSSPRTTNTPANLYLPFDDPRNYWGQFMYRLADRYRQQVSTWIIWNEPDMYSDSVAYTWDGSISDMYQLVKVASQAVKKANPDAKVALPGMTYWWDKEGGRALYLSRFLEAAAQDPGAAGHGDYFDIVVLHQYTNPLNTYAATRVLQRALAVYGFDRPIWVGESNIVPADDPMNPIGPAFHSTLDQQASYIIQAFALARAAGAERMSVYKLVDEKREGANELYGLVRNDGTVRPAFNAYQTAVRYMSAPTSAVYTWDGASDPPSEDQITQLLQSNNKRTQWIWPAAVNRVTLERGAERVTVVWNASPKAVTAHIPAIARSAQVIDKFGRDTGEVVARNGQYDLELQPTSNNTDPRDPSVYLVGGDPRLLVERVLPLPTAVDAPIQVVWPRDSGAANVTGMLLIPPTGQPVPCRWNPPVRLYASVDGGQAVDMGLGTKRLLTQDGLTYPVWDFNAVDITAATQNKSIDFWLDVKGVSTNATRWTYASNVPWPTFWQQRPAVSCTN
ncbi:MAG TPA: hypothetical protein VGQ62_03785 [Chloroflexota bacterium]|nr:hypothetical protein [Chloroflexota bacterium]